MLCALIALGSGQKVKKVKKVKHESNGNGKGWAKGHDR